MSGKVIDYSVSGNYSNTSAVAFHLSKSLLADVLEKYYSVFLVFFGTIGNGLSLAVLSRKTFRSSPIGVYLRCLALSDLTALYTGCVYFSAKALYNYDIRSASATSCRIHRWLSYTAVDMSSWILILVTVARLLSIVFPLKTLCTRMVAYISLTVTLLAALAANLPMFLFYGRMKQYPDGKVSCKSLKEYKYFTTHVWHWIVLVKFTLLPISILIVLNTFLCIKVFRSHEKMKRMNSSYERETGPARTGKMRGLFYEWRRYGFRNTLGKRDKTLNCHLTVSNTDVTRMATTGESGSCLLNSNEQLCKRSSRHSPYISAEDMATELIEIRDNEQGCGSLKSSSHSDPPASTPLKNNNDNRKRKSTVLGLIRKKFSSEKQLVKNKNKTPILSFSAATDDNDLHDNGVSKGQSLLSKELDGPCPNEIKHFQSLRYDSRNTFYLARDSVEYTKEKQKLTAGDSDFSKNEDEKVSCLSENKRVINRKLSDVDVYKSSPIFTISPSCSKDPLHSLCPDHSDSGMDLCDDHSDVRLTQDSDNESSCNESFKSVTSVQEMNALLNPSKSPDIVITHEKHDSRSDSEQNLTDNFLTCSESQLSPNLYDKTSTPKSETSQTSVKQNDDVTNTLTAVSQKLLHSISHEGSENKNSPQHISQPETRSLTPDSRGVAPNRGRPHFNSSRHLNLQVNQSGPNSRTPVKGNSSGFLTPGRKNSPMTSSRQSLNTTSVVHVRNTAKAKSRNLTVTLIVINLVFIICNIPIVIYMTSRTYIFKDRKDQEVKRLSYTMEIVANFTMYTNNAINFILYCLTGTRFRVELRAMLKDAVDLVFGRRRKKT